MGTPRALRLAFAWPCIALLWGCERPRTELMVRVTTDIPQGPGRPLESLRLRVFSAGDAAARFDQTVALNAPGSMRLPADLLGVTPRNEDASRVILVEVSALGPGGVSRFTVRARSAFVEQQTRVLTLALSDRCFTAPACPMDQSCGPVGCEPIDRPSASLPAYTGPIDAGPESFNDAGRDDDDRADAPRDVALDNVVGGDAGDVPEAADASDASDAGDVRDVSDAPDPTDGGDGDGGADVPRVCRAGFGDCDRDVSNGCETPLGTFANCSGCGLSCGEGTLCAGVAEGCVSACPTSLTRCGGACVDAMTSVVHCGGCDRACVTPNATPACTAGTCSVGLCAAGSGDCNGVVTDGCERSLTTVTDCGGCDVRCPSDPANGAYTCGAGSCVLACNTGFVRAGSACVADGVPRLMAPLSGVFLSTTRVAIRVAPANATTTTLVEFCATPSCATVTQSVTLLPSATTATSTVTLPQGTVYWRARMQGSAQTTPVWRMNVRGLSVVTATASAWGSTLDMTLQGSGVVASFGAMTTATPSVTAPSVTQVVVSVPGIAGGEPMTVPLRDRFGLRVFRAGDTDGDGRGEFAVTAPGASSRGALYVFRASVGTGSTRALAAPQTLSAPAGAVSFGVSGAEVGDLNNDGYGDLAVMAFDSGTGAPVVWTYHGGPAGLMAARSVTLAAPRSAFGRPAVIGVGDVNNDGYSDLAVSDPSLYGGGGQVRVFGGGASGINTTPLQTITSTLAPDARFGEVLALAGDLNGDGRLDLAVGAPGQGNGRVLVHAGVSSGFEPLSTLFRDSPISAGVFGSEIVGLGDVNGDGYGDLAIAAPGAVGADGRVFVYHGSSASLATLPSTTLPSPTPGIGYGAALSALADRNAPTGPGPGFDDLVISSASGPSVDVYEGASGGLATARITTALTLSRLRPIARYEGPVAAGDLNRDGMIDVVVATSVEGTVTGFWGATTSTVRPAFTLAPGASTVVALDVADLNQDGYGDVIVGDVNATTGVGRVWIYAGSASGPSSTALVIPAPDASALGFGTSLTTRADLTGDGAIDLAVGAPGAAGGDGRVYVFRGVSGALTTAFATPTVTVSAGAETLSRFGHSLSAGDVTGDRLPDLVVGAPRTTDPMSRAPRVVVIPGTMTGLDTTPAALTVLTGTAATGFGTVVLATGDTDGDGNGDLLVASRGGAGRPATLYRGGAGLSMAPVLLSPTNAATGTGTSIAAGDLNNDGFTDVLLANAAGADNRVNLHFGALGGASVTPQALSVPAGAAGFGGSMVGGFDFNSDRIPDALIVSNTNGPSRAWVLLGRMDALMTPTFVPLSDVGRGMLPSLARVAPVHLGARYALSRWGIAW